MPPDVAVAEPVGLLAPEACSQLAQDPASEERRQQFLNALARNLQEAAASTSRCATPLGSSEPRDLLSGSRCGTPVGTSRCSTPLLRAQEGGCLECPESNDGQAVGEGTTGDVDGPVPSAAAASAVASVLGPDFFAGMDALKERMAQRKASSKITASSAQPGTPLDAFIAASPLTSRVPPPLPTGLSPNGSIKRHASAEPVGSQAARDRSPASSRGGSPVPLPRSERRKPKPDHNPLPRAADHAQRQLQGTSPTGEAGAKAEDDEELLRQADGCGDELLRWADEVLRKAQREQLGEGQRERGAADALPPHPRGRRAAAGTAAPTAPPAPPSAGMSQPSPRAGARQRRAEELREKMKRLMEEAECECERLSAEEAARARRMAAERSSFQDRLNSAAQEMRSNFAQWSFDSPKGPQMKFSSAYGSSSSSSQRSGSMPPPHQPRAPQPPPGAGGGGDPSRPPPLAFRKRSFALAEHEAAWARLEAHLESGSGPIHFSDIPWPDGHPSSLTGVAPGESGPAAKRRLAVALRRWHPDKWRRILDRVPEAEQQQVMERVKSIAQRLLEEKARLAGPGGVLR